MRRRHSTCLFAAVALVFLAGPSGRESAALGIFTVQSLAPVDAARLVIANGPAVRQKRLTVVEAGSERGSIDVPTRVSSAALEAGQRSVLVHPNKHDLAVGFRGTTERIVDRPGVPQSFVVLFLRQTSGAYLAVDVSRVELVNIGFIGHNRPYSDVATVPIEWLARPADDDAVQVRLQTHARDQSGQRYRPAEPLIVARDGRPLWR
jgi:hypothetical protein